MKILEVIFSLSPGGAERFVVDLSNELSKQNEITILTLKDDNIDKETRQFYLYDLSEKVKYKNLPLKDGFSIKSLVKIYESIKNENPDIVHLNGGNCPKFCILAILLLSKGIRFYQTIHNDMNSYNDLFYKVIFSTFGRSNRMHFIALSKTNYDDLKRMHPYVDSVCIVNGRSPIEPTDSFEKVKKEMDSFRQTPNTKVFLNIARYSKQKNQELLIDAFSKLNENHIDAHLFIIGGGYECEEGKRLLSRAPSNVHYIGTKKNISDYQLNADIFTLSSLYEGMPITLLEAFLAGTPIVSTPVCGAIDLVKDGYNGKLSKGFNLDNYYEAIIYAIDNYEQLKDNSKIIKTNSEYTISNCASKYYDFFNR